MPTDLTQRLLLIATTTVALTSCASPEDTVPDTPAEDSAVVAGVWRSITTTATTLTVTSAEPLLVNAPFFGIEVRKNGEDITDDIVGLETLSPTSWRYTFATERMDASGDIIRVSLQNRRLAAPGHYVAVREGSSSGDTVPEMYELLADCEAGTGPCAGDPPLPGLLAAVRGLSKRYLPRDLETAGSYDFSPVFDDAAFLASFGKRLHVIFTMKSFAKDAWYDGDGITRSFPVPAGWDKDRAREIHVYVDKVEVSYSFNPSRTHVVLATAPPPGTRNVDVTYARDPFPEDAWQLSPPVGGWYVGVGGPQTGDNDSHGFVHAPWRATCVDWMREFMAAFQQQWTEAIAADPTLASAIESVSVQETANPLGGPGYTPAAYRAGLVEYTKFHARAVRRRAMFGQLFNSIPGGNATGALGALAADVIPWGARLEGPDLLNDEPSLEDKVYQLVHRDQHGKALTMIWHQNYSYQERNGSGGYYTPAQQFAKAQRGIADTETASGTPGLEAEYVFWNMTQNPGPGHDWKDALPVIAANPIIQPSGNNRHRWRRAANWAPIADQSLTRVNP